METALATVIIGTGVVALLALFAAGSSSNARGAETATAVNLSNNIHELMLTLAFTDSSKHWGLDSGETIYNCDDVEDLDGAVFSPPVDSVRKPINELPGWSQSVSVKSVDSNNVTFQEPTSSSSTYPMARVTVTISRNGKQVYQNSFLVVNPN